MNFVVLIFCKIDCAAFCTGMIYLVIELLSSLCSLVEYVREAKHAPLADSLWSSQKSLGWWAEQDWRSGWKSCVVSGMWALPSPKPPAPRRSAAGCPAQTGPGCRTDSTPHTHFGARRRLATSTRHTASNYWKSCSVLRDSWPVRTVCRSVPRRVSSRPPPRHRGSPLALRRTSRSCQSSPVVRSPVPDARHPTGSRC